MREREFSHNCMSCNTISLILLSEAVCVRACVCMCVRACVRVSVCSCACVRVRFIVVNNIKWSNYRWRAVQVP